MTETEERIAIHGSTVEEAQAKARLLLETGGLDRLRKMRTMREGGEVVILLTLAPAKRAAGPARIPCLWAWIIGGLAVWVGIYAAVRSVI
jgi:hypothetical protein